MKSDIEIAQQAGIRPITEIAGKLGIHEDELELYGRYKAKLTLKLIDREKAEKNNLILAGDTDGGHKPAFYGRFLRRRTR